MKVHMHHVHPYYNYEPESHMKIIVVLIVS